MVPIHWPLTSLGRYSAFCSGVAVRVQALVGAVRQAGVHGPGLVGAVEHLVEALVHHVRQALAAEGGVGRQRGPAAFDELRVGLLEALGRGHGVRGAVERAAFLVAAQVERGQHLGAELAAFLEHGVDRVGVEIGVRGVALQFLGDVEQLVQHELHVAQRRVVLGHGNSSKRNGKVVIGAAGSARMDSGGSAVHGAGAAGWQVQQ
jgi:hypothetical protein